MSTIAELAEMLESARAERVAARDAAQADIDRLDIAIRAFHHGAGLDVATQPAPTKRPVEKSGAKVRDLQCPHCHRMFPGNGYKRHVQFCPGADAPQRGRVLTLGDEKLKQIAEIANEAIRDRRDPGPAVAEHFGIKSMSASVYMAEARAAGHDIPHERPCLHCGRSFNLRGVATHERSCLERPLALTAEPTPVPEPTSLTDRIDDAARTVARDKAASVKLADEIADLRARDRAANDAKGRSAITDEDDDDTVRARIRWTCADCGNRFDRKMDLHRHTSAEHDRHSLHAHEEVGAIA